MLEAALQLRRGAFTLTAQLTIPADGVTAVFGPSGAGKSVLLAALAGLIPAPGARLRLNGRDLGALHPHRRGIGLVFQDARLFPHLSVQGNLEYAQHRAAPGRAKPSFGEIVERFDLVPLLGRAVRNLSGGEKNRVALARALLAAPELLLLDEPFAALDGPRRQAYLRALRETHQSHGLPMLVVTHQIEDAAVLASQLLALQGGAIVAAGPLQETVLAPAFQALLEPRDQGAVLPVAAVVGAPSWGAGVWLRAESVLLAAQEPRGLSARNIWPAQVQEIREEPTGSCLVRLAAPPGAILARVTAQAIRGLGVVPGGAIWAIFKAHGL